MTVLSFAFQHTFGRETSTGFSDTFFWRVSRRTVMAVTYADVVGSVYVPRKV